MSYLPVLTIDVWKKATEGEKSVALATLATLPSRATSSVELDRAAYYVALDGVTRHGLAEAVKAILKGALGHAFFPSPPELRMQCDKAMDWHERMAARIRRRERTNEEFRRQQGNRDIPTTEEKARVSAR